MKKIPLILKMILVANVVAISIILIVHNISSAEAKETCKLVHIIFRHGDRTPTETYRNDPYKNYNWPDGWGALTKKGKNQCYELGTTLHEKYKYFFPKNVSTNTVRVLSSDADRCHMSAATFLAGFFPPSENQIWNPNFNWHPIPIHSLPRNLDNLIAMKKKCPSYDRALKAAYRSEEIEKINIANKDLYDFLAKETGQDMSNITAVEFLYNTLEIEDDNKIKLPDWTKDIFPKRLKQIATRSLEIFTETDFMKKMKGGVLLKEIINTIKSKQENNLRPDRNFFIYSAHDISLINFMRTLNLAHDLKPEYGAAFVMETHKIPSNEDFEIRFFYYQNYATKEPTEMTYEKCVKPCYFKKFVEASKNMVPEDWDRECENTS